MEADNAGEEKDFQESGLERICYYKKKYEEAFTRKKGIIGVTLILKVWPMELQPLSNPTACKKCRVLGAIHPVLTRQESAF